MMLVAGYSGIGKTTLVAEIHKPITEKRGSKSQRCNGLCCRSEIFNSWHRGFNRRYLGRTL